MRVFVIGIAVFLAGLGYGQRMELAWPTPCTAYLEGKPYEAFIQPTVLGVVTSGLFGCVRNDGLRMHQGLDIRPVSRDRSGEATDAIFAVATGVVRHVNGRPGYSNYGRYIVIEHDEASPGFVTLYAHLRSVEPGIEPGRRVAMGEVIGVMGRSAGGYTIPRERAHLHLEMGLRLSDDFQSWYDWRRFGTPNRHGMFNGMNIQAFDPLDFFDKFRERSVDNVAQYLAGEAGAVTIRAGVEGIPDFIQRYPEFLDGVLPDAPVTGWEVDITWYGIPVRWRALTEPVEGGVTVTGTDEEILGRCRCVEMVRVRRGNLVPGRDLERIVQLVFGLRN